MAKQKESVEIYAREKNEPVTLELYLKAHLYGCKYEPGSRVREALYFAPHFGKQIARMRPGVGVGISYVSRIISVDHVCTWRDFKDPMVEERGRPWQKRHAVLLSALQRAWTWNKGVHRSYLLLDEPRLVFNPPIQNSKIQTGTGWLSKRFLSFDELFEAWGT